MDSTWLKENAEQWKEHRKSLKHTGESESLIWNQRLFTLLSSALHSFRKWGWEIQDCSPSITVSQCLELHICITHQYCLHSSDLQHFPFLSEHCDNGTTSKGKIKREQTRSFVTIYFLPMVLFMPFPSQPGPDIKR